MKFSEVMAYYDYNMSNIARALNTTRQGVKKWADMKEIPFNRQCQLEIITGGELKARKQITAKDMNDHTS